MEELKLPIIVCGKRIYPEGLPKDKLNIFEFETGIRVVLPKLTEEMICEIEKSRNDELHAESIDVILRFIESVSKKWKDRNNTARNDAIRYIQMVDGYCQAAVENDIDFFAYSSSREKLYEMLETDIDNAYYLDDFLPYQSVLRHAQPKGKVLHIMAGNIPMAGLFTMLRSIITKNVTIAKLPKRDPVTVLLYALSILDEDEENPVSKSLTIAYWGQDSEAAARIIKNANAVCVWGRQDAVVAIRKMLSSGQELLEFGPKRSISIVFNDANLEEVSMRIASDISFYDQEACFSPQQIFVAADICEKIIEPLCFYLNRAAKLLPKVFTSLDVVAYRNMSMLESEFLGDQVIHGTDNVWAIICKQKISIPEDHPLSRTIYLYPFKDTSEIECIIDKDVQTAAIFPLKRYYEIADKFTRLGISRIVESGMSNRPRVGFAHDNKKVLSRLVDWVTVERGTDFMYKFGRFTKDEADINLFGGIRNIEKVERRN